MVRCQTFSHLASQISKKPTIIFIGDAALEEDKTSYDPVPSSIVFEDDQWINNKYNFNTHGIKALCQATSVNGLFSRKDKYGQ